MIEIEHHPKTSGVVIKRDTYDESVMDTNSTRESLNSCTRICSGT